MPAVSREIAHWRGLARSIPDRPLREDALHSLEHKRDHAEGAAFFSVLVYRRDRGLLRLLVAYQTIWDFLDNASERAPAPVNARQLHRALIEALDPRAPISDYYGHHPWRRDDGYLRALVQACRAQCLALPSHGRVREQMLAGVALCEVQALNHDPDPERRDRALMQWVAKLSRAYPQLEWFELSAAASGFLPHVLLALASERSCRDIDVRQTTAAYFPWVSLALTMLDSYIDWCEDVAAGAHSYVSHYADPATAVLRLCESVDQATRRARALRGGHRHAQLVACMVAMHLARPTAWTPAMRQRTLAIASAAGPLTRLLLPLARRWRAMYLQRADPLGR